MNRTLWWTRKIGSQQAPKAFGGRGVRFNTPDSLRGLETALRAAEKLQGPTVFDVRINGAYESPVSQEIAKALA